MNDNRPYLLRRISRVLRTIKRKFLKRWDEVLKTVHMKRPHEVLIEPTNRCNLNCPFCLVGRQNTLVAEHGSTAHNLLGRKMGMMSPDIFEKVRHEIKKFGIRDVYLFFQGEPFLNVNTISYARILKNDGFYVAIFTNGQFFTDKSIADLVEAEVDLVRFSVDGATEDTYQKNRVGGKFATVYENMKKIAEAHREKETRIEWQFLAMKNNEHEIEMAKEMAEKIGINFFVKGFRETLPELVVRNKKYRATYRSKPCTDIYRHFGIYWDGSVVPCCMDNDATHVMGNISNSNLKAIWNNEKYRRFRKQVGQVKQNPDEEPILCRNCLRWK